MIEAQKRAKIPLKPRKNVDKSSKTAYNNSSSGPARLREVVDMTGQTTKRRTVSASLVNDHGYWAVRGRVYDPESGKMRQRSKSTGFRVEPGQKRKAQQAMREIVKAWEDEANAIKPKNDPLFSETVELWIKHKAVTLRESTISAYRFNINGYVLPRFGKMRTRAITMYDIRNFYDELLKRLSPKTVRKIHLVILGAMEDAVIAGIRPDNPAARIKLPAAKEFEGKAYTAAQAAKLLEVIELEGEPIRSAVTLGLVYGLRRSEICGLRWKDIDFAAGTIHVCNTVVENAGHIWEVEATKTAKSNRVLAIGKRFSEYLQDLKDSQQAAGLVLDKVCRKPDGTNVRPSYLSHLQQQVLKKHGLDKLRLHDLRHSAASLMAKRATLNQVRDFLGHSDISTTYGIYVHSDSTDRDVVAGIMDEILEKAEVCSEKCSEDVKS